MIFQRSNIVHFRRLFEGARSDNEYQNLISVRPQYRDNISYPVNCKFSRHVLLKDKAGQKLEAEIFKDKTAKYCAVCGAVFNSQYNNAKYCGACAETVHRKQKAKHARERRKK
jgi:hypothetical protein